MDGVITHSHFHQPQIQRVSDPEGSDPEGSPDPEGSDPGWVRSRGSPDLGVSGIGGDQIGIGPDSDHLRSSKS